MVVAIMTVHLANGFFMPTGYEFTLTLLLVSLALLFSGAGAYSIDAKFFSRPGRRNETTFLPKAA
jgi:putative oxidoreductase